MTAHGGEGLNPPQASQEPVGDCDKPGYDGHDLRKERHEPSRRLQSSPHVCSPCAALEGLRAWLNHTQYLYPALARRLGFGVCSPLSRATPVAQLPAGIWCLSGPCGATQGSNPLTQTGVGAMAFRTLSYRQLSEGAAPESSLGGGEAMVMS